MSEPKKCIYNGCGRKGAYSFNSLCNEHWQKQIDQNIKKFVEEKKKDNR